VRQTTLWARLLGVGGLIVEDVDAEIGATGEVAAIVVAVRVPRRETGRCGVCQQRGPGYDLGEGRRRGQALALGTCPTDLEAAAPRVRCAAHGVVVAGPWARHGAGHTRAVDDTVAWLVTPTAQSTAVARRRVAWRTVGAIVTRVSTDAPAKQARFAHLRRIGIDEIRDTRGYRYLTVVGDHDSGRLVWAAAGRDAATLRPFCDALGPERGAALTLVSADAAASIAAVVRERCPPATRCLDPFPVVPWATAALDEMRRQVWNAARRGGQTALARELKRARFALWTNPENLTARQDATLSHIARTNDRLYRAYLLKEQLRQVFQPRGHRGLALLDDWLIWASRCRILPFVKRARSITAHRDAIAATLPHELSNARIESVNTKLRLLTRLAFGFSSADALIALAMLSLGGRCAPLPGRA